jgi:hypothetical protein
VATHHPKHPLTAEQQLDLVLPKLDEILRRITLMAVDQATFDAALTDFFTDLDTGLQAIQDKLAALGTPVDLSAELAQVQDAKAKFDAAVQADTA